MKDSIKEEEPTSLISTWLQNYLKISEAIKSECDIIFAKIFIENKSFNEVQTE